MWFLSALTILISLISVWIFYRNTRLKNALLTLEQKASFFELELKHKDEILSEMKLNFENEKQQLREEHASSFKNLEEKYHLNLASLKKEFDTQNERQTQFLLAQNKNLLNEDSKKILEEIFSPIKEQVKAYSERLIQNEANLQANLKHMFDYSQEMGQSANKLASILKGDKKIRGNFGEIQLKSILQHSGLIQGEQYELQKNFHSESGARLIPDAVIYLDQDKSIIIDSKFSLPDDLNFENLNNEIALSLAKNLKNRIDELAKKPYKEFSTNTYDFVLLFIPYQHLLDLALEANPDLYQYAYHRQIYLTTPHTLFMALKTIQITWIDIKRNTNVQQAFEEIEKFYAKFEGVLESFQKVENSINGLQKARDELANRLRDGTGNLNARFQKLQELGVKHKKALH